MSPRGSSPFEVPKCCDPVSQVQVGTGAWHKLTSDAVLAELARLVQSPQKLKRTRRNSIGRARYKIWPGAVVAYYKNWLAVATSHFTILHAQPNGGGMLCRNLAAQRAVAIDIGGAGLKVSVNVWTSAMCGPIRTENPSDELARSRYPQLAVSQNKKWCAPLTLSGKFVCQNCLLRFPSEQALWQHGKVPATAKRLKLRLPVNALLRGPPPKTLAQGSIANPRGARVAEQAVYRLMLIRGMRE